MRTQSDTLPRPVVLLACQTRRMGVNAQCCGTAGAPEVLAALRQAISAAGLDVSVEESPCLGYCSVGPNVRIVGDAFYHGVRGDDLSAILDRLHQIAPRKDGNGPPIAETMPPV